MLERIKIVATCLLLFVGIHGFSQGPSLSPNDLKESYLEKRASYKRSDTKVISKSNQEDLDRITIILEENAPTSYEYHLVKYVNGNYDLALKEHLFEAYKLRPDNREVIQEMFAYYVIVDNQSKQKEFANKLKKYYSQNTFNYFEAMAKSSSIKALFLSGKEDAVPALILQNTGKIKAGITVINMDFLQNESYRKRIQARIGMSNVAFIGGSEAMFMATAMSALGQGAFISTTVSQKYIREPADHTFLTGLHYQYQCENQLLQLEAFWIRAKESLQKVNFDSRAERELYGNYLPPLLTLYKLKLGAKNKDTVLRTGIVLLAEKLGKKKAVDDILKAYERDE